MEHFHLNQYKLCKKGQSEDGIKWKKIGTNASFKNFFVWSVKNLPDKNPYAGCDKGNMAELASQLLIAWEKCLICWLNSGRVCAIGIGVRTLPGILDECVVWNNW